MKKSTFILSIIVVLAMVFSFTFAGCKDDAPEVVEEETAEEAPEETAEEAPQVEYKMAVFFPSPHPFFEACQIGLERFTEDTGIEIYVQYGTDWTQETENQFVEGLVAQGYNAIMVYPMDATGANSLYEEVIAQGVKVVNLAAPTSVPTPVHFTVSTDVKEAAKLAVQTVIDVMGGEGNILNILELVEDPNTALRKEGIDEVVADTAGVEIIQEIAGITSQEEATEKISNAIAALGDDLDGMVTTGYVPTVASSLILTEMDNDAYEGIVYVGIDDDPVVLEAIENGYVTGTFAQSPYGIAYICASILKLELEGYTAKSDYEFINSWGAIVTKDNVVGAAFQDEIWEYALELAEKLPTDYFNPPDA